MPIPDTQGVPPFADFDSLKKKLNEIVHKYNNLLVNLDTLNVVSLNAKVIEANTITADKMNVDELSAITADLGTITAGLMQAVTIVASSIYGSYIATANGTYPRYDIDSTANQAAAWFDANNWIKMMANASGTPLVQLSAASGSVTGSFGLNSAFNEFRIVSNKSINLMSGSGNVYIPSWARFYNNSSGQNLQTALDAKANVFSGFTGTVYVATSSGGSPTTAKTFNNGVCTS